MPPPLYRRTVFIQFPENKMLVAGDSIAMKFNANRLCFFGCCSLQGTSKNKVGEYAISSKRGKHCHDFYLYQICQIKIKAWTTGWAGLAGDAGYWPIPRRRDESLVATRDRKLGGCPVGNLLEIESSTWNMRLNFRTTVEGVLGAGNQLWTGGVCVAPREGHSEKIRAARTMLRAHAIHLYSKTRRLHSPFTSNWPE